MNNRYAKEAGFANVRALFWITVLVAGCYLAYMFLPPYVGYYMLKTEVEGEAKTAHMYSDKEIVRRITQKAAAWSINLDEQPLELIRDGENINIYVSYTKNLVFIGGYEHQLYFSIDVIKPLKEKGRVLQ